MPTLILLVFALFLNSAHAIVEGDFVPGGLPGNSRVAAADNARGSAKPAAAATPRALSMPKSVSRTCAAFLRAVDEVPFANLRRFNDPSLSAEERIARVIAQSQDLRALAIEASRADRLLYSQQFQKLRSAEGINAAVQFHDVMIVGAGAVETALQLELFRMGFTYKVATFEATSSIAGTFYDQRVFDTNSTDGAAEVITRALPNRGQNLNFIPSAFLQTTTTQGRRYSSAGVLGDVLNINRLVLPNPVFFNRRAIRWGPTPLDLQALGFPQAMVEFDFGPPEFGHALFVTTGLGSVKSAASTPESQRFVKEEYERLRNTGLAPRHFFPSTYFEFIVRGQNPIAQLNGKEGIYLGFGDNSRVAIEIAEGQGAEEAYRRESADAGRLGPCGWVAPGIPADCDDFQKQSRGRYLRAIPSALAKKRLITVDARAVDLGPLPNGKVFVDYIDAKGARGRIIKDFVYEGLGYDDPAPELEGAEDVYAELPETGRSVVARRIFKGGYRLGVAARTPVSPEELANVGQNAVSLYLNLPRAVEGLREGLKENQDRFGNLPPYPTLPRPSVLAPLTGAEPTRITLINPNGFVQQRQFAPQFLIASLENALSEIALPENAKGEVEMLVFRSNEGRVFDFIMPAVLVNGERLGPSDQTRVIDALTASTAFYSVAADLFDEPSVQRATWMFRKDGERLVFEPPVRSAVVDPPSLESVPDRRILRGFSAPQPIAFVAGGEKAVAAASRKASERAAADVVPAAATQDLAPSPSSDFIEVTGLVEGPFGPVSVDSLRPGSTVLSFDLKLEQVVVNTVASVEPFDAESFVLLTSQDKREAFIGPNTAVFASGRLVATRTLDSTQALAEFAIRQQRATRENSLNGFERPRDVAVRTRSGVRLRLADAPKNVFVGPYLVFPGVTAANTTGPKIRVSGELATSAGEIDAQEIKPGTELRTYDPVRGEFVNNIVVSSRFVSREIVTEIKGSDPTQPAYVATGMRLASAADPNGVAPTDSRPVSEFVDFSAKPIISQVTATRALVTRGVYELQLSGPPYAIVSGPFAILPDEGATPVEAPTPAITKLRVANMVTTPSGNVLTATLKPGNSIYSFDVKTRTLVQQRVRTVRNLGRDDVISLAGPRSAFAFGVPRGSFVFANPQDGSILARNLEESNIAVADFSALLEPGGPQLGQPVFNLVNGVVPLEATSPTFEIEVEGELDNYLSGSFLITPRAEFNLPPALGSDAGGAKRAVRTAPASADEVRSTVEVAGKLQTTEGLISTAALTVGTPLLSYDPDTDTIVENTVAAIEFLEDGPVRRIVDNGERVVGSVGERMRILGESESFEVKGMDGLTAAASFARDKASEIKRVKLATAIEAVNVSRSLARVRLSRAPYNVILNRIVVQAPVTSGTLRIASFVKTPKGNVSLATVRAGDTIYSFDFANQQPVESRVRAIRQVGEQRVTAISGREVANFGYLPPNARVYAGPSRGFIDVRDPAVRDFEVANFGFLFAALRTKDQPVAVSEGIRRKDEITLDVYEVEVEGPLNYFSGNYLVQPNEVAELAETPNAVSATASTGGAGTAIREQNNASNSLAIEVSGDIRTPRGPVYAESLEAGLQVYSYDAEADRLVENTVTSVALVEDSPRRQIVDDESASIAVVGDNMRILSDDRAIPVRDLTSLTQVTRIVTNQFGQQKRRRFLDIQSKDDPQSRTRLARIQLAGPPYNVVAGRIVVQSPGDDSSPRSAAEKTPEEFIVRLVGNVAIPKGSMPLTKLAPGATVLSYDANTQRIVQNTVKAVRTVENGRFNFIGGELRRDVGLDPSMGILSVNANGLLSYVSVDELTDSNVLQQLLNAEQEETGERFDPRFRPTTTAVPPNRSFVSRATMFALELAGPPYNVVSGGFVIGAPVTLSERIGTAEIGGANQVLTPNTLEFVRDLKPNQSVLSYNRLINQFVVNEILSVEALAAREGLLISNGRNIILEISSSTRVLLDQQTERLADAFAPNQSATLVQRGPTGQVERAIENLGTAGETTSRLYRIRLKNPPYNLVVDGVVIETTP